MENLRNKTQQYIKNKQNNKEYFERFLNFDVYSYTKPNDKKVYLGAKPTEVFSIFKGNTSSKKKLISKNEEDNIVAPEEVTIDQSVIQWYIVLALQDFYYNYYEPLCDENATLRENISMMQTIMFNNKKKNDERFDFLSKSIETLAIHINDLKKEY